MPTNSSYELINLQQYSYFDSRAEMDFVVQEFNKELSKSYYKTLNVLKQYSCKIVGICHLKIETIAKSLDLNVRTVRRHIKYLKENGFITVIPTSRPKKGGDGANAYAINSPLLREEVKKNNNVSAQMSDRNTDENKVESLETPMFNRVLIQKETILSLKLYNSFKVTKSDGSESQNRIENIKNYRECPEGVPEFIYKENKPFFTDGQISKLYESVLDKLIPFNFNNDYENMITSESFKSLVRQLKKYYHNKRGKIENIFKYIKGATVGISNKYNQVMESITDGVNKFDKNKSVLRQDNTNLQSIEKTPEWLNKEEKTQYIEDETKTVFLQELSSIIEEQYKGQLPEYLYNDLQVEWLQKEWYWTNKDIDKLLKDRNAFLSEKVEFAKNRLYVKAKMLEFDEEVI